MSKLTFALAEEIRRTPGTGVALAKQFGVTPSMISYVLRRKVYTGIVRERISPEERFWKYVQKTDTCWPWTGAKLEGNYGGFEVNGKCIGAHVFSYISHFGPILPGTVIRHTCDNPPCVRPDHLLSGTHGDNIRDRDERLRTARGERSNKSDLTEADVKNIRLDIRDYAIIAAEYSITPGEVGHIKHKRIWQHVPGNTIFGNKRCKLTETEILAMLIDPRSIADIAKAYGVGKNAVWYIKHGVTHKTITQKEIA